MRFSKSFCFQANGPRPPSVQSGNKAKAADDGSEAPTQRRMMVENSHPAVQLDEVAMRRGEGLFS